MRPAWPILLAILLAGCADPGKEGDDPRRPPDAWTFAPTLDHDHEDQELHDHAIGMEPYSTLDARDLLGAEPARVSDIQFYGTLAAITVNGRSGASTGGFFLVDYADPEAPAVLGRYHSGSEDNWYTKFSPDGHYVFLTANGNTSPRPLLDSLTLGAQRGVATGGARGIHMVDVTNPSDPKLASVMPFDVRIINLAPWTGADGAQHLAASVVTAAEYVPLDADAGATGYVMILRIVDDPGHLELVSEWRPDDRGGPGVFPHDLEVRPSVDGSRMLLYAAYWDAGAYIIDVTDAAAPNALSRIAPLDASDHIHTFKAHPAPINRRMLAVVAPETFVGESSGTFRLFNVTDPARPEPIAQWRLPPGDLVNPENLLFSPHEFTLANGKLYASAFHGGVWVLDLATFTPVAAWQHSFGDPGRTGDRAVDVATAVYHEGLVYAVDMGSGVVALRETHR